MQVGKKKEKKNHLGFSTTESLTLVSYGKRKAHPNAHKPR